MCIAGNLNAHPEIVKKINELKDALLTKTEISKYGLLKIDANHNSPMRSAASSALTPLSIHSSSRYGFLTATNGAQTAPMSDATKTVVKRIRNSEMALNEVPDEKTARIQ